VNRLVGEAATRVGAVRADDRKGRHTTTHREILRVPKAGLLLDGPGIREFGLLHEPEAIELSFADVLAFAEQCAFSGCSHEDASARGCAVLDAVRTGKLQLRRLLDYRALVAEANGHVDRRRRRGKPRRRPREDFE
jgi:ribosome biogenesis GTPase